MLEINVVELLKRIEAEGLKASLDDKASDYVGGLRRAAEIIAEMAESQIAEFEAAAEKNNLIN